VDDNDVSSCTNNNSRTADQSVNSMQSSCMLLPTTVFVVAISFTSKVFALGVAALCYGQIHSITWQLNSLQAAHGGR